MNDQTHFGNLRDILSDLYIDEASARIVVHDAGLDARLIDFRSRAKDNWHAILTEAVNTNRVDDLFTIVLAQYGENPRLRETYDAYTNFANRRDFIEPIVQLSESSPNILKTLFIAGIASITIVALFVVAISVYIPGIFNVVSVAPATGLTLIPAVTLLPSHMGTVTSTTQGAEITASTYSVTPEITSINPSPFAGTLISPTPVLMTSSISTPILESEGALLAYQCDAQIISSVDASVVSALRREPRYDSQPKDSVSVGMAIFVLDASGTREAEEWYKIMNKDGRNLGWIPADYVELSLNCPTN